MAPERARSAAAVDEAVFLRLAADLGTEHIEEVCLVFLENAALGVDAVRQALDAEDAKGAAEAAHKLRSGSGFMGATRLADLCAAVEGGSPAANSGEALVVELRRTSEALHLLLGRVAGADRHV